MEKVYVTLVLTLSLILAGCGGGGSSTATTKTTTKATLIDAPVWGVEYQNSDGNRGITAEDGTFDHKKGTTRFYVGKVKIGEITTLPSDKNIFIHDLFDDVKRGDITSDKVLKVATFLQSIDSQPNNNTIIEISNSTKSSFLAITDEISLSTSKESVESILLKGAFITKASTEVIEHLKETLTKHGIEIINTTAASSTGIENSVPASLKNTYGKYFNRYTKIVAPNSKHIHLLAQKTISDEQLIRVRGVLEHYLKNYDGSLYGSDKTALANKMADNKAMVLLLDGSDDGTNPAAELGGQPLYKSEIQVEGGEWYTRQDYEHRDATYEEILHLVHDTGIGVDGTNTQSGVLPEFQQEIRDAQTFALTNKIWGSNNDDWITELTNENSLSQEYLAALIDAYYGLWGAWKEDLTTSMHGIYTPRDREEIKVEDELGNEVLNNRFFHPYLTYNARIDADFQGTFSLRFDESIPYSYHSRYLKDITLLGNKNTDVQVNELDNDITGNSGTNIVIFTGGSSEYTVSTQDAITTVSDKTPNRDGSSNFLKNIEKVQFSDKTIEL